MCLNDSFDFRYLLCSKIYLESIYLGMNVVAKAIDQHTGLISSLRSWGLILVGGMYHVSYITISEQVKYENESIYLNKETYHQLFSLYCLFDKTDKFIPL